MARLHISSPKTTTQVPMCFAWGTFNVVFGTCLATGPSTLGEMPLIMCEDEALPPRGRRDAALITVELKKMYDEARLQGLFLIKTCCFCCGYDVAQAGREKPSCGQAARPGASWAGVRLRGLCAEHQHLHLHQQLVNGVNFWPSRDCVWERVHLRMFSITATILARLIDIVVVGGRTSTATQLQ
ncbi:hypothetical protein GOP47_0022485 [Adiantum capillus-veneris]|uniref:Uncharacterized protein n=1 Tax=Adiantum capillus-veneris TaxID=13818 RepID=A0A9D4Z6W2_ADICA|nr:hypothetical protein GOP47_0022485 [Adiantum capillus-veneris]